MDRGDSMLQDIRYACRLMGRQKLFTAAAVMTLALGIGANTAMFSLVYGVLLRPLPYPASDRLVRVFEEHPGGVSILRSPALSNYTYYAWRESQTLEGLGGYARQEYTLGGIAEPVRVAAAAVSPSLFGLLGARPLLGRTLREEDAAKGAAGVAVLSHSFWGERFGFAPSVVGSTLTLDGAPYTIVGVMPSGFQFPDPSTRFWLPYRIPRPDEQPSRSFWGFWAVARLRPGATPVQAAAEGTAAARSAGPRPPAADLLLGKGGPVVVRVRPLLDETTARVRPALLVLLASAGVVLFIACGNVANLLLSRGVGRSREFAVRAAIGAGRGRLLRQCLAEAAALSLPGGAAGIALAWALIRIIPALAPEDFPRLQDVRVDGIVLAFAGAAALLAGVIGGVLPAVRLRGGILSNTLRDGGGASAGVRARRLGGALLVAEAAFAVVLLVAAGLLGRSFVRLLQVDPGYDARNVLMARVYLPPSTAANRRATQIAEALLERVRRIPGVTAAGASNMAPFVGSTAVALVTLRGDSPEPISARAIANVVTPGFAEALAIPLREGRYFTAADAAAGIRPILVNEEFVRVHLGGRSAAGRRFADPFMPGGTVEIVGVLANVLKDGLDARPQVEMYNLPREPYSLPSALNLTVRTSVDPLAIVPALRGAVREADAAAALDDVDTLGARIETSLRQPRFAMAVLAAFAALALTLAAVGLYGVLSYQVAQRRRELGVRAALGASRRALVGLVVREGVGVTLAGIGLGLLGAAWTSRLLEGLLFGVTPDDALTFVLAPASLLLVALAATILPARRAALADPIDTLRSE